MDATINSGHNLLFVYLPNYGGQDLSVLRSR